MCSSIEFQPEGSHANFSFTTSRDKFYSPLKTKTPQSVSDILIRFKLTKSTEIDPKMDAKLGFHIKESHVTKIMSRNKR